ncbi:glycosyltransferase family 4 protein [Pseudomonadota bacterium]
MRLSFNQSHERLRVLFLPFNQANPYQLELEKSLGKLRVEIVRARKLRVFSKLWFDIDIIHIHWPPSFEKIPFGKIKALLYLSRLVCFRALGKRLVYTAHNLYAHESTANGIERFITRFIADISHKIIVHSPAAGSIIDNAYGRKYGSKYSVIFHGNYIGSYENSVDKLGARRILSFNSGDVVFLMLGNLRPYKGLEQLIREFSQIDLPKAVLCIAGRPLNEDYKTKLESLVADCPGIILHPKFIEDHELQIYFNAANIAIYPYTDVLTSGAVVLGMSFGIACIAPIKGCIPDYLDHKGAFLYDPIDQGALKSAIKSAYQDEIRLLEMGRENLEKARGWTWDCVAEKTLLVYQK